MRRAHSREMICSPSHEPSLSIRCPMRAMSRVDSQKWYAGLREMERLPDLRCMERSQSWNRSGMASCAWASS